MEALLFEVTEFLLRDPDLATGREQIDPDEPLLEGGLIDSMGVLKLIAFLEERFGVVFGDDDIDAEKFRSIRTIVSLVSSKRDAKAVS
ncbi:acyl carrier protein [Deferrisoma camini]|uniref:acyl carrier protein n=1 Tax=Deferrisoma camini TaxID=1035120 RepID=UPI00046CE9A7|nr:acyl carrier protein [Deferrisoma camini]